MRKLFLAFAFAFFAANLHCQVGIGTTTPSPAAMLEIAASSDGGSTFKGFMPPRVPGIAARDAINPASADVGLMVFVESIECLQIWNGTGWESMHCINNTGFVDLFQNFDLNTSWGYSSDIPFFDNGTDGFYGITTNSTNGFNVLTTLTNNFLGILDLQDDNDGGNGGNNGTAGYATITFDTVNTSSSSSGLTLSFDYEFYEYDSGDNCYYTLVIDGIDQPEITLIEGVNGGGPSGNGISLNGSVSQNIPSGTTSISMRIRLKQNGQGDYAGFDNFSIVGN